MKYETNTESMPHQLSVNTLEGAFHPAHSHGEHGHCSDHNHSSAHNHHGNHRYRYCDHLAFELLFPNLTNLFIIKLQTLRQLAAMDMITDPIVTMIKHPIQTTIMVTTMRQIIMSKSQAHLYQRRHRKQVILKYQLRMMVTHTATMLHAMEKVTIMEAPACTLKRRADTVTTMTATVGMGMAITRSLKTSMPISRWCYVTWRDVMWYDMISHDVV